MSLESTKATGLKSYQDLEGLSEDLLQKYNTAGPRYTSYPTAPMWTEEFGPETYKKALEKTNQPGSTEAHLPLSLYTHLPFCEHRCHFCGCNVVITPHREQAEKYLGYLFQEIDHVAQLTADSREVVQLHWGGGTPTYLSSEQIQRLFHYQKDRFNIHPEAEIAIEVDPRVTTHEQLTVLHTLGFNRISMGVQDFHLETQQAVNRIQSIETTEAMVNHCRELGFSGINFDLIYGLPHQTEATFDQTLNEVIRINPDRIALYNFAYVPWISPHQKKIDEKALPEGSIKFKIFRRAIERFLDAGYVYIGMDHFAKPTDELTQAQQEGSLHRNFMGYTTKAGCELYGFGVSAISGLESYYAQNLKKLSTYYEAIESGNFATMRGFSLSQDDRLRRTLINGILCQGTLDFTAINSAFNIDCETLFSEALTKLAPMFEDGLLTRHQTGIELTPLGRIFSRNIAMPFDAYFNQPSVPTYSKTL